jgi:predicted transcriptional regulator of viral defense system
METPTIEKKQYYKVNDVMEIMGVSKGFAYKLIRNLNKELEEKGYLTVSGRIPVKYFEDRCY